MLTGSVNKSDFKQVVPSIKAFLFYYKFNMGLSYVQLEITANRIKQFLFKFDSKSIYSLLLAINESSL